MKDTKTRLSNFLGVTFNMTSVLLLAIFLISQLHKAPPLSANLRIIRYGRNNEYKTLAFVPGIELTPQFNYHTKMVFLYLNCKTETKEEMVWSKIVRKGDSYKFFEAERNNYNFTGTKGTTTFELRGNVYPHVGVLRDVHYGVVTV